MAFLSDECIRLPLTEHMISVCAPFSCGNKDLDEFFSVDFLDYRRQLMGENLCLCGDCTANGNCVCFHGLKCQYFHELSA